MDLDCILYYGTIIEGIKNWFIPGVSCVRVQSPLPNTRKLEFIWLFRCLGGGEVA